MTKDASPGRRRPGAVTFAIGAILVVYLFSALLDLPQRGTELTNAAPDHPVGEHVATQSETSKAAGHGDDGAPEHETHAPAEPPGFFMVLPFALLLGAIAVFPLSHATEHWWDNNLHRFYVAAGLGLFTLAYYAFVHAHPVDRHFLGHAGDRPGQRRFLAGRPLGDFPERDLQRVRPLHRAAVCPVHDQRRHSHRRGLAGPFADQFSIYRHRAVLANLIGTTGAAMLLVRPLLETNSERKHVKHTVVFFIFAVCNCGGCLLPIGDPPLFLGYLQGVDFLWTLALWPQWLLVNGVLIAIYFAWDHFCCYPHEAKSDLVVDETHVRRLRFSGVWPNAGLLLAVVVAVALLDPAKPLSRK